MKGICINNMWLDPIAIRLLEVHELVSMHFFFPHSYCNYVYYLPKGTTLRYVVFL